MAWRWVSVQEAVISSHTAMAFCTAAANSSPVSNYPDLIGVAVFILRGQNMIVNFFMNLETGQNSGHSDF